MDVRHSSPDLLESLAHGLVAQGVEVLNLGLCGTEEVYSPRSSPASTAASW